MNLVRQFLLFFLIMSSIIAIPIQYSEAGASNSKPVLMPIGDQKEDENDTSEIYFSATDDDDDILTFTSSVLPRFAVLMDNGDGTAKLALTTSLNDAGTYQITITVTDNGSPNQSDSETFDLVINDDGDEPEVIEIESDVNGDLVVTSNQIVFLTGVTVDGNLQVNGGVIFITESSIIKGNIESNGGTIVINPGSTIYGNVDIGVSGPGGVLEIEEGNVFGNLITNGIDTLTVIGSYVDGNIFSENDSNVTITGNTVNGNLEILGPSNCSESSNDVNGNNSGCP